MVRGVHKPASEVPVAQQDASPAAEDGVAAVKQPVRRGKNVRGLRTRQELLDAALSCFSEYGYARTRISDIVFRAGVSQGNFYRHFESKNEIFLESLRPSLDELTASTGRSVVGSGVDLDTMVVLATSYLTSYTRNRHILRVMREAAASSAEEGFTQLWLQQRAGYVERTGRWLRRLHQQGAIAETDFDLLADVLGSTIEQTAYVHIGLAPEAPRPERIHALAAVVGAVWHRALPLVDGPHTGPGSAV
ncbi:TetR/AcrR family transcriptional regulator [Pseudonocardia sp. KRD-184]|uniref:TetR/AcrR family transcriptional regulator n=1 Tax=Pseudonocardia oceani TaxID=2792013 RepID=A0ABS6U420_9PSEU|nr:TetR/AcrR family transcriptional regulator [Pseudonocardia oceani]MBW0096071.1 TetR/AcrR family transcriptional regulator [Pseudonocardia oceani]MBW0121047.1 TetR/AcrR family transcriptional regulator [Pseudonocardia oceani]MBW0126982.1 TetR/AcrR family transcriptional regulator [Pseudonocardia oceani]